MKSHVESVRWSYSLAILLLASVSVMVLFKTPEALGLALFIGLMAIAVKGMFNRVRSVVPKEHDGPGTVANAGLVVASISIVPLILFAFLWAALLLLLGMTWLLNAIGLI